MTKFMENFDEYVEYPKDIADDPLPLNTLYAYVSNDFLIAFVNRVQTMRAYLLHRYQPPGDRKRAAIANFKHSVHSLTDDLAILSRSSAGLWYFFYFDQDTSDCMIGRFITGKSEDTVRDEFETYVNTLPSNDRHSPELPWPLLLPKYITC